MKALHLSIIGAGIGTVAIATLFVFVMPGTYNQQNSGASVQVGSSGAQITVTGMNDTYLAGQQIRFNLTTTSKECSRPSVTVTSENGSTVWTSKQDAMFCDMMMSWPSTWNWRFEEGDLGNLIINSSGTYKMTISFLDSMAQKDLHIVQ